MAKAVGLDIGTRSIKVAEIEGTFKKYKLVRFSELDFPALDRSLEPEEVVETVSEFLKGLKIGRDCVITLLPAHCTTIREITVPFKNEEQIRKVVKFEAETHLHAIAIEDVVVDYIPVAETADGTRLVVFAAPKDEIRRRLDLLKSVDVDPRAVDLDVIALFNAVTAAGLAGEDTNLVVADIGATSTKLLVIQSGELKAVRSLRTGADSITRRLEDDLDVPFLEAEERQALPPGSDDLMVPVAEVDETRPETAKSADRLEVDMVTDRRREFLEKVSRELNRSMATMPASSRIDAFYVTGGGSRSPEVLEELSGRFDVHVEPLDLFESIPVGAAVDPAEVNAVGAVAVGSALKQIGATTLDVDFRQEEFAFARKFEIIKLALAVGVAFVFILVFLYFLQLKHSTRRAELQYHQVYERFAQREFEDVKKRYEATLKTMARPHKPRNLGDLRQVESYRKAMGVIQDELVNELGVNPDIPRIRSSLTILRAVFERMQDARMKHIEYFRLKSLTVDRKGIRIKGAVSARTDIGKLREAFDRPLEIEGQKVRTTFTTRAQGATPDGYFILDAEIKLDFGGDRR